MSESPREIQSLPISEADPDYRVFTTEFDEVVRAEELAEPAELTRLRENLDKQLEPYRGAVAKMANRLHRQLLAQQKRFWEFDREEGILDAGRLARIVANPTTPLSFKVEKEMEFRDTVVNSVAGQFRIHAWQANFDCCSLCRYTRAHARKMSGEGRNPGFHHASVERW